MTWQEWLDSREAKRAALRKYGVDAPSRRRTSYDSSERFMRQAFGGERIPQFAQGIGTQSPQSYALRMCHRPRCASGDGTFAAASYTQEGGV